MVILDNSRTLGAFERQSGILHKNILFLYLHCNNNILNNNILNNKRMKLDELQTRLTHLLTALSNEDSRIIQGFTKAFIEDFTPNQTWVISLTEIEGYDKPLIEYTTWDESQDGPIPGIKLFKHLNIFLEREYCEY